MKNHRIFQIILTLLGFSILVFFSQRNCSSQSKLIAIDNSKSIEINVTKAYNERGIQILNDSLYISFATLIDRDTNKIQIEDDAIWRPKESKHIKRFSDIDAPYKLQKRSNSDSIRLIREFNTLTFIIKN